MEQGSSGELFALFVYGTLKCGFENHDAFCKGALRIEEATVGGELYDLPFGFPALVVPRDTIRGTGTANPIQDVATQRRLNRTASAPPRDVGPRAFGELLTLDDPDVRLPKLDQLEGFTPGSQSLYQRVLVPVETASHSLLAWAYATGKPTGTRLPDGRWPS